MRNNVAFLINSLAGGGAERVVSTLMNHFVDDYDCTLIVFEEDIDYDLDPRIKVVSLNVANSSGLVNFLSLPFLAFKLSRVIKSLEITTLVSFLHRANYVNCLSRLFSKHRIVISERIASSSLYSDNSIASRVSNFLVKSLYPKADLIVSVSHAIKADLERNYQVNAKQVVIYNPYDIEAIRSKSELAVPIEMDNTIVTVGSLSPRKGHLGLIKAFSKLADKSAELVILGVGEQLESLKSLANELGVSSRVRFVGFDSNPYKYLSKAKLFVLNSESEGFPNVLAEALVCNCAVVSTDCLSGPREILAPSTDFTSHLKGSIEHAKYGILVPVGDPDSLLQAIESVYQDPHKLQSMRGLANEAIQTFTLEHISSQYLDVIFEGKN
ncbi:N-acetylgalactosamine-N, N'-diacetylbacillosaminyl-diphospho-undecaprenol 4-alpha-N-acetylgalactosaminyltransferase [Vibrio mediterranei]|uniref:glycosyltransferase n=1 Tax=Vibrio TaxID=662 RepID=UPI0007843885|nr:glycosyltransferase [Vibrio mediterranei]PTC02953.1 glycosyltransferase [Vibrio mediterranei]SBO12232.1 N-acetylgalactosamine-N, N'-diacetylbacillosaminyl-diphospho-undecaprenol 4-alpha-N-acetylgalactosaminyltransferase [Vibrio mediterranei]